MKASLLSVLVLVLLLPSLSFIPGKVQSDDPDLRGRPLSEYFEPGQFPEPQPLPMKQIIGFIVAGLASLVILLFVFSFLMGPGERLRDKMSERSDPFFTIVAILLIVLLLSMVQTYYNDLLEWLKTIVSSG